MTCELINFDFDGVIADSELISNSVLAEFVTRLGYPMSTEDAIQFNLGRRWDDVARALEELVGHPLPPSFAASRLAQIRKRFRKELRPVPGVKEFLHRVATIRSCVASSSSRDWIDVGLQTIGLNNYFEERIFTADLVSRAKPFPDIFLLAARAMDVDPADVLVIEDSPAGVSAAVAAGMKSIGLHAGSHNCPESPQLLADSGATWVLSTYEEAAKVVDALVG